MDPYQAIQVLAVPIGMVGGFAFIEGLCAIDRIRRALWEGC